MVLQLTLEPEFGYVIALATAIAFECLLIGFLVPGHQRGKVFTQQFLEENFGLEHKRIFGTEIKKGGYPDMGNGRYAEKLSYEDWVNFNKAQRVHYNFVEQIAPFLTFMILTGLLYPVYATVTGAIFFVARLFFLGYMQNAGAHSVIRSIGALLGDIAILMAFGGSTYTSVKFVNG